MRPALPHIVLAAVLVAGLATAGASAQSSTPWADDARAVDFHHDANGFRFVSVRPGQEHEERLSGVFDLGDARFSWGFEANRSAPTYESMIVFSAILEWRDADRDGAFGVGDEVVRRQPIGRLENATLEVLPRPPAGQVVHATYPFPGGRAGPLDPITGRRVLNDGGFTLSFHLFGAGATIGAHDVDPTRLPLDVRIEKWPHSQNGTRLGLEVLLQSVSAGRIEASSWQVVHDDVVHDFTWASEYTRNGSARLARMSAFERPGDAGFGAAAAQTTLLAAYEPGNVVQSFSFGTEPRAQGHIDLGDVVQVFLGNPRVYAVGAVACALVVGSTAARRLRNRG